MNAHEKSLDILLECVTGQREVLPLLFAMAKLSPATLIAASGSAALGQEIEAIDGPGVKPARLKPARLLWVNDAYNLYVMGDKLNAAQLIMSETGMNLIEVVSLLRQCNTQMKASEFGNIILTPPPPEND